MVPDTVYDTESSATTVGIPGKPWSKKFPRCVQCGTQAIKHRSRGLCVKCYARETEQRAKAHIAKRKKLDRISGHITKDELQQKYRALKMSLGDIARDYNCTRQNVLKLFKKYGIERRDKATARGLALSKGKVIRSHVDQLGNVTTTTLRKRTHDKFFFKSWAPDMAYVLGVIYTDGCITQNLYSFTVAQKEPELLQKCLKLMGSDAQIGFTEKRGIAGAIHHIQINDKAMIQDLLRLGLTPKKSLTLDFPEVPSPYVRHFIRGCWDGDGSVYLNKRDPRLPGASFTSGSERFAAGILKHLVILGMPNVRIHKSSGKSVFQFRFDGPPNCVKLYHIFYDDVPETMYLKRKYERFERAVQDYEKRVVGLVLEVEGDSYVIKDISGKKLRLQVGNGNKKTFSVGDMVVAVTDPTPIKQDTVLWTIEEYKVVSE